MQAGIRDILIIVPPGEVAVFENLLQDGAFFGAHVEYKEQEKPRGIADAFVIGAAFIGDDNVCLALGDNIFFGAGFRQKLRQTSKNLTEGATIF